MKHLLFLILLTVAANAHAQCDQFDNLLKKGDAYLKGKKPNYQEAINAYTAAILACSDRASEAQKRIANMVNDINRLKENALTAERKATTAQKETEAALLRSDSLYEVADAERKRATAAEEIARKEAETTKSVLADLEIQKALTDSALQKAEKLINAFYFYGDRFALAFKDDNFYFIDKNGDPVEKLGEYEKAEQFDETGFAKVIDQSNGYLLDTFGIAYSVAFTRADLKSDITALDLRSQQIKNFPIEVLQYEQLKVLILNREYDKKSKLTLPHNIEKLTQLKSLQLAYCQLSSLPVEIGQLKNLQSLDLGGNELSNLPAEIGQLKNLQSLHLSSNELSNLPAEIGQLNNLQFLEIRGALFNDFGGEGIIIRGIIELPVEIGQLKNLQTLGLSFNRLSALPPEIGELKNLQALDLSFNRLSALPPEIRSMKSLKELDLEDNPFSADYIEQLRKDMPWCEIGF